MESEEKTSGCLLQFSVDLSEILWQFSESCVFTKETNNFQKRLVGAVDSTLQSAQVNAKILGIFLKQCGQCLSKKKNKKN